MVVCRKNETLMLSHSCDAAVIVAWTFVECVCCQVPAKEKTVAQRTEKESISSVKELGDETIFNRLFDLLLKRVVLFEREGTYFRILTCCEHDFLTVHDLEEDICNWSEMGLLADNV